MERDLQDLKEEIRARSDIVDVIGGYLRLTRAGKDFKGLCPFHNDRKPSFSVSPSLQIYKCYSCGEGGDVFKFIQKKENLDFIEALEFLARRAGLSFERKGIDKEKASEREQLFELNALAVKFYKDRLQKSQEAKDYLARRGLLKETQERFDIGFAPPDWEALTFHLTQKRVDLTLARKIGLIKERQEGRDGYYDAFRNRVLFPIHDVNGRVIAFGGRALGDDQAKYLNSEQSVLFDKSRTLYGLVFARKKISGDTPAVFVEGYVDVVTAHQAGFTQCVATLGTSMTEEHARMLARYSPKVIICYDGDAAGIKATLRGATVWESIGVEGAEVRVARLPEGDDPDSLLRRGETAAFQAALDNAVPRVDFQIELILMQYDTQTRNGRSDALAEVIPLLASIPSLTARDRYAQRLAYLHPSHSISLGRAIEQILTDAASYARQSPNGPSPRDRNYPLTEQANRERLKEQPDPPTYRPSGKQPWGAFPMTENLVRKGEGRNGQNGGYDNRPRRRDRNGPASDPTPPPLDAPLLTGAEKAERQLLRALFSAEWRTCILSRLHPAYLVTESGRRLFQMLAITPSEEDGSIDPLPILRHAEDEENAEEMANKEKRDAVEGEIEAKEPLPYAAETDEVPAEGKFSYFIRALLEDSPFLVSNARLNEAAVLDCITRLQRHWTEREQRRLADYLQRDDLTPEQMRAAQAQYLRIAREIRGSSPADGS